MRRFYVYRTDSTSTQEWYVGIRSCMCDVTEDVRYMGSGVLLKNKMGAHPGTWVKTILVEVEDWDTAREIEAHLVGPKQIKDQLCLNLVEGGQRGVLGLTMPPPARAKMSVSATRRWESQDERDRQADRRRGKKHTSETRQGYSDSRRGSLHPMFGKHHTDEAKQKISAEKRGSCHTLSILDEDLVFQMRLERISGRRVKDIAEDRDIRYSTARNAICGHSWKHVPFPKSIPRT